jgi:phage anti-repressor protein
MNQIIAPKSINFNELVKNSNTTLSLNLETKMINILNTKFTEEEQRWYIANLYIYMNYHPTNDYPINLEDVFKMIGFANKGNAKRTLENNFILDEDYKSSFLPTEKREIGGSLNEQIMLNVDTFKSLCMLAKTDKGKEIRKYYVKLENIYNELMKEEIQEQQNKLQNTQNQLQLTLLESQEKQDKINLLTRKTNKFEPGESVYIFHSTINNDDNTEITDITKNNTGINLYKVGRTKNANGRDAIHKTASYKGILLQIKCVDSVLLERVIHFLLNKYRCANRREWFNCSYNIIKNSIYYAKLLLESEIDFENIYLVRDTTNFIDTIKESASNENEIDAPLPIIKNIFTTLEFKANDINDFEKFLSENCEKDSQNTLSYTTLKNQYKIWAKTANHSQLKKMINYVKVQYTTCMKKYNPLVSTSKLTQHFNGIKLNDSLFKFENPDNDNDNDKDNLIVEQFLYDKCQRAPGYRITMQEFFLEFEKWYSSNEVYNGLFTHIIKDKLKSYLDILFIRLRSGDESNGIDNRLGGWLGFALKTNNIPEPIKKYKPKNAKIITQKNATTDEIIKEWSSISELSDYIKKSRSVTSLLIKRHEQIYIDNILCFFI